MELDGLPHHRRSPRRRPASCLDGRRRLGWARPHGDRLCIGLRCRDPDQARLLCSGILAAGTEAVAAQAESIELLAARLREGRDHYADAATLTRHTERVLVAGCASLIGERLRTGGVDALPSLEPQLVEIALGPYLGLAEARRLARA